MALATGSKLGPYELTAAIGAGGMGEVYRARDLRLNRDVAVKVLPSSYSSDPQRLRRFEQEALATATLNHPNILAVHDIGTHDGFPYIVSELLEGETLRERLSSGPLTLRKAIDYAIQIARGLASARDKGVVHRDLKPENIFLTRDGRLKLLDFGLAKLTQSSAAFIDAETRPVQKYRLLLRSCKLIGAFVISPLPPVLSELLQTAGPLRSTDIARLPRYYRPGRIPLAVRRLPGANGYTASLLRRFLDGARRVSPVA